MRASEARLEARIDVSAADMRRDVAAQLAASAADTRRDVAAQIAASTAETRRHMDVVAEALTSKIALVAEGVVTLTERLSGEMREGFETLDRRVMRLEARLLTGERG